MFTTPFVRVRDELGNEISVHEDDPNIESGLYTPLPDKAATDRHGAALPPVCPPRDESGGPLHGKALDAALETAALSKSGTVAEKQARLAEHNTNTPEA
jgi:hypothetical protein